MNKIYRIPSYSEIFDLLEMPEWLNGLENYSLSLVSDKERDAETLIETARQFQYLYDTVCSGRFNLCTACKGNYSPGFLNENASQKEKEWIQTQFVNNAILWYNATFDILLQAIWFYYKLYLSMKKPLSLTVKNHGEILRKCDWNIVKELGPDRVPSPLMAKIQELRGFMFDNITQWANHLKHRGNISYKNKNYYGYIKIDMEGEQDFKSLLKKGGKVLYDSTKTKTTITINNAIATMILYHQRLIDVTKVMYDEIKLLKDNKNKSTEIMS